MAKDNKNKAVADGKSAKATNVAGKQKPSKSSTRPPAKLVPKKASVRQASSDKGSDSDSNSDEAAAKKAAKAAKVEELPESDEESNDDDESPKKSAAPAKATTTKADDSDDSSSAEIDAIANNGELSDGEETGNGEEDEASKQDESDGDDEEKAEKHSSKKRAAAQTESTPKKQKVSDTNENRTCFVGNLSFNADEDMVTEHFADCGEVVSVRIVLGPDGRKKGYGYVEFADAESAKKALELAGSQLDGREIRIDLSTPRPDRKAESSKSGDSDTLFVGNLSFDATVEDIQGIFAEHGEVTSCRIPTDRESGNPKGNRNRFGYVTFASVEAAKSALEALNGFEYLNRSLRLDFSVPRTQSDGGRGGFRGGRGGFGGDRGRGGFGGRGRGGRGGRGGWGGNGRFGGDRGGRGGRGGFSDRGRGGRGGGRGGFSAHPSGKKATFE
ncbi:hypothetical protein HDU84_006609 [Entophlyctis sp. JEL0112]|nr:hypothetical protein HDU84_006609 [Entophlyctis sp. JEL0112]